MTGGFLIPSPTTRVPESYVRYAKVHSEIMIEMMRAQLEPHATGCLNEDNSTPLLQHRLQALDST